MSAMAIQKEVTLGPEATVERVSSLLKEIGFGILTRIDFDQKIKEKLNETIPKTIVLGACNPRLAYEAYKQTTDVALLIPCNVVIHETGRDRCKVEIIRPSQMMKMLAGLNLKDLVQKAENDLEKAFQQL
jgi:uncharacterized protein (DUF302 family)